MAINALGWLATAVFSVSYLTKGPATLRKVQAAAACLWILYGLAISAVPVVAANAIVACMALYSLFRRSAKEDTL